MAKEGLLFDEEEAKQAIKKSKLPPDIERIQKLVKQIDNRECPFYPNNCIKPKARDEECDDCAVTGWLSKLTEHGVVVLDKANHYEDLVNGDKYYKVVKLDGTPMGDTK